MNKITKSSKKPKKKQNKKKKALLYLMDELEEKPSQKAQYKKAVGKRYSIRITDPILIKKVDEFQLRLKINNKKTKNYETSFNSIVVSLIDQFVSNKLMLEGQEVIAKLLIPMFKQGFKNTLNDLTDLMLHEFATLNKTMQESFYLSTMLSVFSANVLAMKEQVELELDKENSKLFKLPKWTK